ncbi:hypothetical protein CALCODRAFT_498239 [Calocera cornea HHB12733]|uniref:DUF6593 domain-containing protein n=1 Tax=Calocera cornea HHB12733 TaxID=1353952 RepID=A0A165EY48_9BASI|nr:hypothetical protein CALCODRAFT_498239 [Calocera cornea HHB12733]
MGLLKSENEAESEHEFDLAQLAPDFAYAKRLAFSGSDPLKRVITEEDGPVSYTVVTKSTMPLFGSDITTITRVENGSETEVAKIDWKHYEDDHSELQWSHGEKTKMWEYLKGPSFTLDRSSQVKRTFQVKGQEYTWQWASQPGKPLEDHFELIDINDVKMVRDIRDKGGLFIRYTRSGGLLVNREALDILDQIIVTHTAIAQKERMEYSVRRDAGAAALNMTLKA